MCQWIKVPIRLKFNTLCSLLHDKDQNIDVLDVFQQIIEGCYANSLKHQGYAHGP
jgi:hypothetical protein